MDLQRWQQIDQIFQAALEREPGERAAFLTETCSGDQELRSEVEALLSSDEQGWGLLEENAFEAGADLLSEDQPELFVGELVGHYKVLGILGAGGMGQVYLAEDTRLGRKVALKLLPTSFTQSESRLRRFQQEARAASALNHPNILTIHDIWEIEGRHIIVTEYVEGESLRQRIKPGKLASQEALEIASQVASALWAAHQARIIHRDIKPENIMLRRDGLIKVLDFGLAKLVEPSLQQSKTSKVAEADSEERSPADKSGAGSSNRMNTESGLLMGTLPYMSPEQLNGEQLDARTDIFSLGVVVHEMVTGRLPFEAPTRTELIDTILRDDRQSLSQSSTGEGSRLQEIVDKALRKDREGRFQSSGEMLAELIALKQESALRPSAATGTTWVTRYKKVVVPGLAILAVAAAVSFFALSSKGNKSTSSFQDMKITRLTSHGSALGPTISPDGKYVFCGRDDGGKTSLWLKEVNTNSEIQIASVTDGTYFVAVFSPDSKYIYYSLVDREYGLYQMPVSGGNPRQLPTRRVLGLSFSPDGKRFAYVFNYPEQGETIVRTANADGTDEQDIVKRQAPSYFPNGFLSWSPDGKSIVCPGSSEGHRGLVEVNIEEKTERPIPSPRWSRLEGVVWLPDMSGLIVAAGEESSFATQIWRLSYPTGEARRITNDLNNYDWISLTADGNAVVALQIESPSRIWVMPVEGNSRSGKTSDELSIDTSLAKQISISKFDFETCWTPDGKIVYVSAESGNKDIWMMDADGTNRKQLTTDFHQDVKPSVTHDGRYIVFESNRRGEDHIWRMDIDGRNEQQLTNGRVERNPLFSADGNWVVYNTWETGTQTNSKVRIEGGQALQITESEASEGADVSPEGRFKLSFFRDKRTNKEKIRLIRIDDGATVKIIDLPSMPFDDLHWARNEQALTFLSSSGNVGNIWLLPLDGGQPRQLTNFRSEGIVRFSFSADGKQLACVRATETRDIVMISNLR